MDTYYRLSDKAVLCGYKDLPFSIFDYGKMKPYFYNREEYSFVLRCTGTELIDADRLSESEKATLKKLADKNLITKTAEPSPLKPHQQYRKFNNICKTTAHWSVTGRCNYKCRHCFMSCPDYRESDISLNECKNVIRQMAECGIRSVSLTGGEPLVRPDFMEIIKELRDNGILVSSILTNGALVNDKLLDDLEQLGIYPSFQLSYDGVGWHDWLRGVNGAEETALRAFRLLQKRSFATSASMTVHKHNKDTLRESVNLLAEVGCSSMKVNVATCSGLWVNQPEHFLNHEDGYQLFLDYIPRYYEDGKPVPLMLEDTFMYDKEEGRAVVPADRESGRVGPRYVCMALRNHIYVSPSGQILPCQSFIAKDISAKYPNLFATPLKEILTDSTYTADAQSKLSDLLSANAECRDCKWAKVCCGGCRAVAVGDHDMNYQATNKDMCLFFKNGWYEKFTSLVQHYNSVEKEEK